MIIYDPEFFLNEYMIREFPYLGQSESADTFGHGLQAKARRGIRRQTEPPGLSGVGDSDRARNLALDRADVGGPLPLGRRRSERSTE